MSASNPKLKGSDTEKFVDSHTPTDPKGVRIDGYFGPGLLRPGVGKLVQRSGEPQFCGSLAWNVTGYEEGPHKIDASKISRRYTGEFWGRTYEGKEIRATEGYLPSSVDRATKALIDRGQIVGFAGDLWCEPAEKTPLGYAFRPYDRTPRGAADPLMALAVAAGLIEPPALPAIQAAPTGREEVDPETGEVIETETPAVAAQ